MSRVINFDKGSKWRLRRIRWKRREAVSAVLLFLALTVFVLWFVLAQAKRERPLDLSRGHKLRQAASLGRRHARRPGLGSLRRLLL